jgi:putative DNA primase/helicase
MKHIVTDTVCAAAGHWPQLLLALGISINAAGQHSPCPVCGGKDRFRFDNQAGRGTWVCNQCGAGDGLALVEKALDVNTKEAACRVADLIGTLPVKPIRTPTEKN